MRFKFIRWRFCMEFVITFSVNSTFFTFLHILLVLLFYATLPLILPLIYTWKVTLLQIVRHFRWHLNTLSSFTYFSTMRFFLRFRILLPPSYIERRLNGPTWKFSTFIKCSNTRWCILCMILEMQFFSFIFTSSWKRKGNINLGRLNGYILVLKWFDQHKVEELWGGDVKLWGSLGLSIERVLTWW